MKIFSKLLIVLLFVGIVSLVVGVANGFSYDKAFDYLQDEGSYTKAPLETYYDTLEIHVDVDTRNVIISASDTDHIEVDYYTRENEEFRVYTEDNKLYINQRSNNHFMFWFDLRGVIPTPRRDVRVSVPRELILSLDVDTHTGLTSINDLTFNKLRISSTTGDVVMKNVNVNNNVSLSATTGSIKLDNVVGYNYNVSLSTGDVYANNIKGIMLDASVTTGKFDIKDSEFETIKISSSTGSIYINDTIADIFTLSATTGSIHLKIVNLDDYSLDLDVHTGSIIVKGSNKGSSYQLNRGNLLITADTNTGSIYLSN